jgi:prevent-host-death family protein
MDKVYGHIERAVPVAEFKQRCLALLDEVADSGVPLVVTKRGRPVVRVIPVAAPEPPLRGSIRVLAENEEALFSTEEEWDAEQDR